MPPSIRTRTPATPGIDRSVRTTCPTRAPSATSSRPDANRAPRSTVTTRRSMRTSRSGVRTGMAEERPAERSRLVGPASSERTMPGIPGAARPTATGSPARRNQTSPRTAAPDSAGTASATTASASGERDGEAPHAHEFTSGPWTPPRCERQSCARTITTGHGAESATSADVEPSSAEARLPRPWLPTTSRSASSAASRRTAAGAALHDLHDRVVLLAEHLAHLLGRHALRAGAARVEHARCPPSRPSARGPSRQGS